MKAKRVQDLIARRDELAKLSEALASTPEAERPTQPSELKQWLQELEEMQRLVDQMDTLIARAAPHPRVCVPDVKATPFDAEGVVTLARLPKGRRAEMRVSVKPWQGRQVIDIRLWSLFDGSDGEMRPSRKGIAFDAAKLDDLIAALHQAKQHV